MAILLEVCVATVDDAMAAERGGASRIELNTGLALGGLSPSTGLLTNVLRRSRLPTIVMVRPRAGGFCYSQTDFEVMLDDARTAIQIGAAGIACGFLLENGEIDVERCRTIRQLVGERDAVFHRAFDVTPEPFAALEQLIALQFTRVMTSGQAESAEAGSSLIAQLVHHAARRIEILPAGGISAVNVVNLLRVTGCNQVHGSFRGAFADTSVIARRSIRFSAANGDLDNQYQATDESAVRRIAAILNAVF